MADRAREPRPERDGEDRQFRYIVAGLRQAIDAHGPIGKREIGSAAKRINRVISDAGIHQAADLGERLAAAETRAETAEARVADLEARVAELEGEKRPRGALHITKSERPWAAR